MSEHVLENHNGDHDGHNHHIQPISVYVKNLLILAFLMGATIFASFLHLGTILNNIVALGIACLKAFFVVSVFMGVKWGTNLVKLWAILGFVWVLLLSFIFSDYTTRGFEPTPSWDKNDHGSAMQRDHGPLPGNSTQEVEEQSNVNVRPRP